MKCLLSVTFLLAAVGLFTTVDSVPALKIFATDNCTGATTMNTRPPVDACQNTSSTHWGHYFPSSMKHLAIEGGQTIVQVGVFMNANLTGPRGTCAHPEVPSMGSVHVCGQCRGRSMTVCDVAAKTARMDEECNSDCSVCAKPGLELTLGGCASGMIYAYGAWGIQSFATGSVASYHEYETSDCSGEVGKTVNGVCNSCTNNSWPVPGMPLQSTMYDCETAAPTVLASVNPDEVTAGAGAHFAGVLVALVVLLATAF